LLAIGPSAAMVSSTAIVANPERGKLPAGLDGARASRPAANERYIGNEELSIEELLTDPIAALLRCRDGLSLDDVCRCIAEAMAWTRFRAEGTLSPHCHKT
jgi:hypothetical protein